jgi:hypothetical protein
VRRTEIETESPLYAAKLSQFRRMWGGLA